MRKTKSEFRSFDGPSIDTDELAQKIAKATANELRLVFQEILNEFRRTRPVITTIGDNPNVNTVWSPIDMDESIIPIDIEVDVETTNLQSAATSQKVVDKDLRKNKSKLAGILKGRK